MEAVEYLPEDREQAQMEEVDLTPAQVDVEEIDTRLFSGETGVPVSGENFQAIVEEVKEAIRHGVDPTLISQGSSGSYFCRDKTGKIVGVFKPKDEEPYGDLNPKWVKWIHRTFCPCCFGRSCLPPNTGYLSEVGASIVDRALELNIVPRTEMVMLSSKAFNYAPSQKRRHRRHPEHPLPEKIGSFQLFVNGYKDASCYFRALQEDPLSDELKAQFRLQFERLAVLDYIIRNTDRGNQNWLIKLQAKGSKASPSSPPSSPSSPSAPSSPSSPSSSAQDYISIAAIDNGLAFPLKHPDNWRFYPFGWASIAAAHVPFSDETAEFVLAKLENPGFCDNLVASLKEAFGKDTFYTEARFAKQMAVMRGQIYNLVEALKKRDTPANLMNMAPMLVTEARSDTLDELRSWISHHHGKVPTFTRC